jgi:predicted MPP superfamily phosphohydrolase
MPDKPQPTAPRFSRRRFLLQAGALATLPLAVGVYSHKIEPFWPSFPEIPIRIKGLPKSFENYRIAQVTDMHTGRVPLAYLQRVLAQLNDLKPDLVAFTGDLIHHDASQIPAVESLLKSVAAPFAVSYGNHDFGPFRGNDEPFDPDLPEQLEKAVTAAGAPVLRNRSMPINRGNERLWLVGLDDLWFGEFNPSLAFADVPRNEPVICLSHNPDTAEMLAPHGPDLILSGHTHGGQIRIPFYGAIRLNVAQPQYDMGHFHLPASQLYVSRGVGYIISLRFNCRPEVPVFRLVCA